MLQHHILTVGISVLTNFACERQLTVDDALKHHQGMADFLRADPLKVSAELNSLNSRTGFLGNPKPNLAVTLIFTTTGLGKPAASLLEKELKFRNVTVHKLPVRGFDAPARDCTPEFAARESAAALTDLRQRVIEHVARLQKARPMPLIELNGTGGYKAECAVLYEMGRTLRLPIYYLHALVQPDSNCRFERNIQHEPRIMTAQDFLAGLTGSRDDFRLATEALRASGQPFCLIGGLAVNHYVEPVVTLDADFAIAGAQGAAEALRARGFEVEEHSHSINARYPGSRLRIQITINSRYAAFPSRAVEGKLFGVSLPVASLEDLVQGKLWALQDPGRRPSKKLKDKTDLARICESQSSIVDFIPPGLIAEVDAMRSEPGLSR
jgi:putative CRISPR-associated protein (TIGR02619 family)